MVLVTHELASIFAVACECILVDRDARGIIARESRSSCGTEAPTRASAPSSTVGWPDVATTATNHWKLGLFVVAALATMVAVTFWIGAQRFERESFQAISYFDESVQGLDVGSPVKWRGVTVGTVSDLTVAPDGRHVQVTSDIFVDALTRLGLEVPQQGQAFIHPNLRVQLASVGITGIRFLQTDFFDPERHPPPPLPFEPPWNYVPSTPSTLKSVEEVGARDPEQASRRRGPGHGDPCQPPQDARVGRRVDRDARGG